MLKKILMGLGILIVGFLIYAALQPADYRVERSITINAPAEKVFPHLNNQKNVNVWSPWLKVDPTAKITFEGPEEGVGAKSAWVGNKDLGSGKSEIVESRTNEYVKTRLDFLEPFESMAHTEFLLKSEGTQSMVTWTMFGKNTFVGRVMCVIFDMDKMIGGSFEKGLADLKILLETT